MLAWINLIICCVIIACKCIHFTNFRKEIRIVTVRVFFRSFKHECSINEQVHFYLFVQHWIQSYTISFELLQELFFSITTICIPFDKVNFFAFAIATVETEIKTLSRLKNKILDFIYSNIGRSPNFLYWLLFIR